MTTDDSCLCLFASASNNSWLLKQHQKTIAGNLRLFFVLLRLIIKYQRCTFESHVPPCDAHFKPDSSWRAVVLHSDLIWNLTKCCRRFTKTRSLWFPLIDQECHIFSPQCGHTCVRLLSVVKLPPKTSGPRAERVHLFICRLHKETYQQC